jgi:hypothetical protein
MLKAESSKRTGWEARRRGSWEAWREIKVEGSKGGCLFGMGFVWNTLVPGSRFWVLEGED